MSNPVVRFLAFLNLTEYTRERLSWSNISLASSLVLLWYTAFTNPDNTQGMLMALGGVLATTANYAWKRHVLAKGGTPGDS